MTGRRSIVALAAFAILALLSSCERVSQLPPRPVATHSRAYADPAKQLRFEEALKQAGVSHEVYKGDDGMEYVRWKDTDSDKVDAIEISLFGEPLPDGRHIHFGAPHQEQF